MINYLLKTNNHTPIDKIVNECLVSKRSVYNYLDNLKNNNDYILDINKNGVLLKKIDTVSKNKKIPQDYEERRRFILRKGLIAQRTLHVEELLNYLQISEATFHSELIKLRREIAHYHVKLSLKDDDLNFVGNYHDLKKLIQSIIYQENNDKSSLLSFDNLTEVFPDLDVEMIRSTLISELNKRNYFMDEYSLLNLLLHILISTNQELNGVVPVNEIGDVEIDPIISSICDHLEHHYDFKFSNSSKHQFSLLLETRSKDKQETKRDVYNNEETKPLMDKINQSLYINYAIDMSRSDLNYSFMMHLDSLFTRLKNNVNVNNPMLSVIKRSSPITYDLAVVVANIISKEYGYKVSESEIAYIALHLGTRIEEIKSFRTRLKAIIVCPEYYVYNSPLHKIVELYKEDLYISNVYTSFDYISDNDVDLIICTIEPDRPMENILFISNFLNSKDRNDIANEIINIKKHKKMIGKKEIIKELFKKELFFKDVSLENRDEAIEFLTNRMEQSGYVDETYKSSLVRREEIAPTNFGLIAIPHPAEYNAKKTVISAALLDKQVMWASSKVSIIMMIAINNKDFSTFDDVFSSLCAIAGDATNIKQLLSSNSYEEFLDVLMSLMFDEG